MSELCQRLVLKFHLLVHEKFSCECPFPLKLGDHLALTTCRVARQRGAVLGAGTLEALGKLVALPLHCFTTFSHTVLAVRGVGVHFVDPGLTPTLSRPLCVCPFSTRLRGVLAGTRCRVPRGGHGARVL